MTHFVSLTGSCFEICKIIQCPNEHSCRQMSFDYVLAGSFLPVICSVMLLMERPAETTWDIRGILLSTTASMHGNASAIFISIFSVFQYPSPFFNLIRVSVGQLGLVGFTTLATVTRDVICTSTAVHQYQWCGVTAAEC